MGGIGIGTLSLLTHVPDFEGKNRQAVDGPRRALGIDGCILEDVNALVTLAEVGVNLLDQIGAVLVAVVDAALQGKGLDGVDILITNDILEVPLHGVNPVLAGKVVLDGALGKRVAEYGINVVGDVVQLHDLVKYLVTLVGKCHDI